MAIDNDKLRDLICASCDESNEVDEVLADVLNTSAGDLIRIRLGFSTLRSIVSETIEEYKNLLFRKAGSAQ